MLKIDESNNKNIFLCHLNINLAKNNFLISFCNEEIWNHFDSLDSCNPPIIDWKFGHTLLGSYLCIPLLTYICKPKSLSMTKNRQFLNMIDLDIKYLLKIYYYIFNIKMNWEILFNFMAFQDTVFPLKSPAGNIFFQGHAKSNRMNKNMNLQLGYVSARQWCHWLCHRRFV